jgi:hypothetical protein
MKIFNRLRCNGKNGEVFCAATGLSTVLITTITSSKNDRNICYHGCEVISQLTIVGINEVRRNKLVDTEISEAVMSMIVKLMVLFAIFLTLKRIYLVGFYLILLNIRFSSCDRSTSIPPLIGSRLQGKGIETSPTYLSPFYFFYNGNICDDFYDNVSYNFCNIYFHS